MLAGKGRILVVYGVFTLTAGFSFINYFLITLGLMLLFSAVISLPAFQSAVNIEDIEVYRELEKNKLFKDDFLHVKVVVRNTGGRRFDFIDVEDRINPDIFRRVLGDNKISTRIDPHSEIKYSYVIEPKIRGEQPLGPLTVTVKDRLGFNAEERIVPNSITRLLVYPPYADIRKIEAMGAKRAAGRQFGSHRSRHKGIGSEFYGMREYIYGDEFRKIDWKASARLQKLIVREFETEKNINMLIVMDSSESMGAGSLENTKYEYSVRAAMLLAKLALEHRDSVGLFIFSDEKNFEFLPPSADPNHFFLILDYLAKAKPQGKKKIVEAIEFLNRRYSKRSLVFFLSDLEVKVEVISDAFKKLRQLGHEVIVISPFAPWFEILETELTASDKALAEAIAEEMMEHVLNVRQKARALNIPVLSVGPEEILRRVITEYNEAKKKGKAY
ncbi:MAG: DUF58 domain-containing protein [Promethearchaeota archaeon]